MGPAKLLRLLVGLVSRPECESGEPLDSIIVGQGILQGLVGENGQTGACLSDALDGCNKRHHPEVASLSHLPPKDIAIDPLGDLTVRHRGNTLKDDTAGTRKILKPWRLDSAVRSGVRYFGRGILVQWLPAKSLGQVISQFLGGHLIG